MQSHSLLIVDDNKELVELLQESLSDLQCVITTANSVASAARALAEIRDLHMLITDVQLPDGKGHAVAATALQKFPDCLVVYMSAYHEIEAISDAVEHRSAHFFKKPFSPARLKDLIRSYPLPKSLAIAFFLSLLGLLSKEITTLN